MSWQIRFLGIATSEKTRFATSEKNGSGWVEKFKKSPPLEFKIVTLSVEFVSVVLGAVLTAGRFRPPEPALENAPVRAEEVRPPAKVRRENLIWTSALVLPEIIWAR